MSKQRVLPADVRSRALTVLLQLQGEGHVQAILDAALTEAKPRTAQAEKDAALCTQLVYGFLRYELRVDFILDGLLKRKDKLPREMLLALGLATYALLFLQRMPHHAIVHWAVDHVRGRFGQGLGKVCNGVLRTLQRMDEAPKQRAFYHEQSGRAAWFSMPQWIVDLWDKAYGREPADLLLQRSLEQPCPCIRLNPYHAAHKTLLAALADMEGDNIQRMDAQGWSFAPGHSPHVLGEKFLRQWEQEGAFSWQSGGTQTAMRQCLEAVPELRQHAFWDSCAGQGGKTFWLLENGVKVDLCSDTSSARLEQLRKTAVRLGLDCPTVQAMPADMPFFSSWKGNILLDVPCSGFGTLARRPEIRRRRKPEDVIQLQAVQKSILHSAWTFLEEGRYVIYMTCTLNPTENEEQVQALLAAQPSAKEIFTWQTPHQHPWLEGMFVSIICKT